jgi:3-oxoacyl-[acyl-carrier protein] reductase
MKKKTVLLTGASRGMGEAIYKQLKKDYAIIAPAREDLDLSDNRSIAAYVKKNKNLKIDILINNAGINFPQWIEEMEDENIEKTIQINLVAPIKLVRAFVGNMKKNKWGRIVNISSAFGIVARGKQVLYASTKHGINGMTKALALELAKDNILVNSVCPGFTKTDLVVKTNTPEKIALLEKDIPLGRLAEPSEIANLVEFLISDKNTYMTGSTVVIDGGFISR